KVSRLSLALPPLSLQPFAGPGGRKGCGGAGAGGGGGRAGGAGAGRGGGGRGGAGRRGRPHRGQRLGRQGATCAGCSSPRARPRRAAELDRKRKMVSFYDDVTVYLFDQETPTNELSSQSGPEGEGGTTQGPTGQPALEAFPPADGF
ncbi:unnamed protein product, partial [Eretmochelys imbricata]